MSVVVEKYDFRDLLDTAVNFSGVAITNAGTGAIYLPNEVLFFSNNFLLNTQEDGLGTNITGYTVEDYNELMTNKWDNGRAIYERIKITDPTYQTGTIYAFGEIAASDTKAIDINRLQNQINALAPGAPVPVGTILSTAANDPDPEYRFCDYDTLSQANFPELFSKIEHDYAKTKADADTAETAGTFHLPEGSELVLRQHVNATIESVDISNDQMTVTGHKFNRNGMPVKIKATTTIPAGLLPNTQYYIKSVDANTISFHPTEDDAINNTNKINITSVGAGTITISGKGCYLASALQGFKVWAPAAMVNDTYFTNDKFDTKAAVGNANYATGAGGTGRVSSSKPVSDGIHGTPNETNETRDASVGVNYQIKVENITPAGEPVSALRYSTGWVANSDWTNAEFNVTHSLNEDLSNLLVKFFISTDGTEANAFEIDTTSPLAAGRYGTTFYQTSVNAIKIQTAELGLLYVNDSGLPVAIDTQSWYYKIVVIKPSLIATYTDAPIRQLHTITTATDVPISLPDANGQTASRTYKRRGSGTGKVTFSTYGSQTIEGLADTTWYLEGDGLLKLIPVSGNWEVEEFEDFGGTSANYWKKTIDGIMKQWGVKEQNPTSASVAKFGSSAGTMYYDNDTITFMKVFTTIHYGNCNGPWRSTQVNAVGISSMGILAWYENNTTTDDSYWEAIGRWRT